MLSMNDARTRFKQLYGEREQLRLEHNEWGRRFRDDKITTGEWEAYKATFKPKSFAISKELGDIKNTLLKNPITSLQRITGDKTKYPLVVDNDIKKFHYLLGLEQKIRDIDMKHPLGEDVYSEIARIKERLKSGV